MAETPPPLELLAVHRQSTRALSELSLALDHFLRFLVAPSHDAARQLQTQGQAAFDRGAANTARMSVLIERHIRIQELGPGWWTIQGSYDTGRVAWEATDRQVSTIANAAELVRQELTDVPGVPLLADEFAVLLLPAISAATFQDPLRLIEKARLARTLLDAADAANPNWIADPALLAQNVWWGHRQLVDQIVTLGSILNGDPHHRLLLEIAVSVYQKLVEGPLLHLGGPLYLASLVPGDPALIYDTATWDPVQVGGIVNHFLQHQPLLVDGAEMLLRNADAHYGFDFLDEGIEFRDRTIHGDQVTRQRSLYLLDEDFLEQLVTLDETLVALELALLPYLWQHSSPVVSGELERLSRTFESRLEQVRFLAGLHGFVDLEIEQKGQALDIRASYQGPRSSSAFVDFQATVAAVWTLWDDVTRVRLTLDPDGESGACEVNRDQFPRDETNDLIKGHMVALLMHHLRSDTEQPDERQLAELDARFALLPAAFYIKEASEAMLSAPTVSQARELLSYMRWLVLSLPNVQLGAEASSLRDDLVGIATRLTQPLTAWQAAQTSRNQRLSSRLMNEYRNRIRPLANVFSRIADLLPDETE
jgi:hypothetical protein